MILAEFNVTPAIMRSVRLKRLRQMGVELLQKHQPVVIGIKHACNESGRSAENEHEYQAKAAATD